MFRYKKISNPTEKPPYGSIIDPTHPLSYLLSACYLFNEGGGQRIHNLVSDIPANLNIRDTGGTHGWSSDGYLSRSTLTNGIMFQPEDTGSFTPGFGNFSLVSSGFLYGSDHKSILLSYSNYEPYIGFDSSGKIIVYHSGTKLVGTKSVSNSNFSFAIIRKGTGVNETEGFIDGELDCVGTYDRSMVLSPINIMGSNYSSNLFDGLLKSLYFYHRALSDSEMQQLHAEPYANILIPEYWHMCDFGAVHTPAPSGNPWYYYAQQ